MLEKIKNDAKKDLKDIFVFKAGIGSVLFSEVYYDNFV